MPWNGSGSYAPPAASFPEVNGTVIDANRFDATILDIATGITNCLTLDGQNSPTANIPMGGFTFTGLGAGAAAGQPLIYGQAGTMGTLRAGSGLVGSPSYTFFGDASTGMWNPANFTVAFSVAGLEAMRIHQNGQVTMPGQPAFFAESSAASAAGTTEATTYGTEVTDIGSSFDQATGRFTAPVAGTYAFFFSVQANTTAGSGVVGFLRKNSVAVNYGAAAAYAPAAAASTGNARVGSAAILTLAAGDYVSAWTTVTGGAATLVDSFSGHLIG